MTIDDSNHINDQIMGWQGRGASSCSSMAISSASMIPMRPLDVVAELREQIKEEVRQELISEKANESCLKELTPERMKRKLDSILSKEKTDE